MVASNLKLVKGSSAEPSRTLEKQFNQPLYRTQTPAFPTESSGESISIEQIVYACRSIAENQQYDQSIKSLTKNAAIFNSCLQKWKQETQFTSSLTEIIMHPSYQRIIGLGPHVISFILQELADNGGQWFWALQALSGENPVPEEDQGRMRKMVDAWLEWGKQKQLI